MRALKIVGIIVAALVGLVVLGLGAILLLVDPNDYRDDIAKLVEQKTGRPLEIRGKLDLKVFPWLALGVHDVTLGNPPGYGKDPFLTVQNASVGVKLFPLLRKQVQVSRVSVDGLSVTLISRGKDANNWKDLGESKGEEPASTGGTAQATVAGVQITQSTLLYRDEEKKSVSRLSRLEIHTGAVNGSEPVKAEIKFDYDEGGAAIVAHLDAKAQVQWTSQAGSAATGNESSKQSRLDVKDLDASGKWYGSPDKEGGKEGGSGTKTAKADGTAHTPPAAPIAFSLHSPALAVDMGQETLAPATFDVKLGDLPVQLTAQGENLFGDYVVSGKLGIERTSARKLMQSFGMEPPVTSDPKALSVFAFGSNYQVTPKQLKLSALDVTLDDTRMRGAAGIEDLDRMALRFDLDVNAINLDRYLAPEQKAVAAPKGAPAAAKPPTDLPLDTIRGLDVRGQLRIGRATVDKMDFINIRLPVEVKDDRAHLGPTQAGLFGGTYNGDIVLDAHAPRAALSMNEHVRGIDMGALMKAGFDTTRVVGKGNANAQLNATGNTDQALFKSLAGKIDFDVKDGAVTGADLWYELRRAFALYKGQASPERSPGPPKTAFNTLSGSALVNDGVVRNDDLTVDMTYLKVTGKGTLGLQTQAIDYRLVTEVYKLPPPGEAGSAADLSDLKAAAIPVTITGTLADMKIRPDVEGYLKARLKKEVSKKVDEKKDELKKKLSDKLKGLLGH